MKTLCIIPLVVMATFTFLSQPAIADDLADLKATHEMVSKAWNTGDLDTVFEIWQDGAIWMPANMAFPVVINSAMLKPMLTKWLEKYNFQSW